ncbi:MAG: SpoIID/LytB domain-containing protein [Clostridiales bacterium]|nr:SpoIID/LytB domain-containing protein [Clostridiales bacterium]
MRYRLKFMILIFACLFLVAEIRFLAQENDRFVGTVSDDSLILSENPETEDSPENFSTEDSSAGIVVPETVRVLITQDNNQSVYREDAILMGSSALHITGADAVFEANANETVDCKELMDLWQAEEIRIEPEEGGRVCVSNAEGSAVSSYYCGAFCLYRNENGIWIVNEIGLEDYLCGVVPGEMPERFEEEALKAQAICARTYVCLQMAAGNYMEYLADVDDTTDCQVYLPSDENEKTTQAVKDTTGDVLVFQGSLAPVYYFSTSCGYTSGLEVWQGESPDYLHTVSLLTEEPDMGSQGTTDAESANPDSQEAAGAESANPDSQEIAGAESTNAEFQVDAGSNASGSESIDFDSFLRNTEVAAYDSDSRYFRWQAILSMSSREEAVKQAVKEEFEQGSGKVSVTDLSGASISDVDSLGEYVSMSVEQRNPAGMVTDLRIRFSNGTVSITHENAIRTILGTAMTSLTDKNSESVYTLNMLPSAAFSVDCLEDGTCRIFGGGLGHGIGMSQYGADGMAKAGKSCEEILETFFPGTVIINVPSS